MNVCGVKEVEERWQHISYGCSVRKAGSRQHWSLYVKQKHQSFQPCVLWPLPEEIWQFSKQSNPPATPACSGCEYHLPGACWSVKLAEEHSLFHFIECFLALYFLFLHLDIVGVQLCPVHTWLVVCSQTFIAWTAPPLYHFRQFSVWFKGCGSDLISCMRICSLSVEFHIVRSWKRRRTSNASPWNLLLFARWRTGGTSTHPLPKGQSSASGWEEHLEQSTCEGCKSAKDQTQTQNKLAKCPLFLAFVPAFCFLGTSSSAFCFVQE